jgi:hypothetical protein
MHTPTNELVLFGRGTDGAGGCWYFDGAAWQHDRAALGNLVGLRHRPQRVRRLRRLHGGVGAQPRHVGTSGRKWTEVTKTGPEPRDASVLAYDSNTKAVVLYGGVGERGEHTDTWQWRDSKWTQLPAKGLGPFDMPAMAHDPVRRVTVLVGAPLRGGVLQVWEMANANWARVQ